MSERTTTTLAGALPDKPVESSFIPVALTWLTWSLFAASIAVLAARRLLEDTWEVSGIVAIDGLTVLMWVVVTLLSGVIHSYSRRYMAGSTHETSFFLTVFGFTIVVMGLVAANHIAVFGLLWLPMGLLMAKLIGINSDWKQARAAAAVSRKYFLASSALLGTALITLWWTTGATTISAIGAATDTLAGPMWLLAAGTLVGAVMIQSALVPFHNWLLSSMTAPTPASALMHAGFVNAGGILLTRFAPVITIDATLLLGIVLVGALSAILGKLFKSVQTDVKGKLACSTVGQMGFMIMQAGLGFFGAAITHLILHGFYKAYHFLSAGEQITRTSPRKTTTPATNIVGIIVILLTGVAGGVIFAVLTGKGTHIDTGLLLAFFVVLTTFHAARGAIQTASLPPTVRYGAVPLVFLPAITVYALVYIAVSSLLTGLPTVPAPTELTVVHGIVVLSFIGVYLAIETGVITHSKRLYVGLLNASQPAPNTVMISAEEYNEY